MRSTVIVSAFLAVAPWLAAGCVGPETAGASARSPEAPAVEAAPRQAIVVASSSVSTNAPTEVPERDPAARGRALPLIAADLPDDRDGDGVDQLDLCPELPPDRVDGCPRAR